MNRRLIVSALVGTALVLPQVAAGSTAVHAAHPSAIRHTYVPNSSLHSIGSTQRRARAVTLTRSLQSAVGSVQSSEQLRLPASAFPADSFVDTDRQQTALGTMGGWFQYYTKQIPDGLFDVTYLGSYYPTPDDARKAFDDVRSNPKFARGTSCFAGDRCYQDTIGISFQDGEYHGVARVVQQSNALAEVISVVPAADDVQLAGQIEANVDRVTNAFVDATRAAAPTAIATSMATTTPVPPTLTPTSVPLPSPTSTPMPTATATTIPTDFDILSIRTEKVGSKPDIKLARAPIRRLRVGTSVYASVYVVLRSAPVNTVARYEVRVTAGGKTVLHRTLQDKLGNGSGTTYRKYVAFKPAVSGTYKVSWQVTVGAVTKQKGMTIAATK